MKKILSILPFLILYGTVSAKIPETEKMALLDLYANTKGQDWTNTWDLSKDVTSWYGIEIKDDNVVSISLMNNNLKGILPESIGALSKLKVLNLAFNVIQGKIPRNIVELENLIVLRLGKNKIKGSIPEDIDNLKKLVVLDLFANKISGILPRSVFQLKKSTFQ